MMPLRPFARFSLVLAALALLLAACAPAAPDPQPTELPPATQTPRPDDPVTSPTRDPDATADPNATPELPAWAPQPGDVDLDRGDVFLDVTELLLLESYPVQVQLHLEGSLPTPCHQLRVAAAPPDAQGQIAVEVYSVVDPGQVCTQQLQPFAQSVNLGSYPSGSYTVLVNGEKAAEIVV